MAQFETAREAMVRDQLRARGIDDPRLLDAFRKVPRERFVPERMQDFAYDDGPLPIGEGQTISQPYIVALMIDAAGIAPGSRVLEVGAGSGYAAAILSQLAGNIIAVERHEILAQRAAAVIAELGYDNVRIVAGDGLEGFPDEAPFDAILVAARAEELPEALKRQVGIGGTLVIPVGGENTQSLRCYRRESQDEWSCRDICPVRFVPLLEGAVSQAEEKKV